MGKLNKQARERSQLEIYTRTTSFAISKLQVGRKNDRLSQRKKVEENNRFDRKCFSPLFKRVAVIVRSLDVTQNLEDKMGDLKQMSKYFLFFINCVTFICGLVLFFTGIVLHSRYSSYFDFLNNSFFSISTWSLVMGVLLCLVSFLGELCLTCNLLWAILTDHFHSLGISYRSENLEVIQERRSTGFQAL